MGLYRNCRPIAVDAKQCTEAGTIATDLGFSNVERGEWIIRGEDGESYILNNEAFQRTFAPVEERQLSRESRGAPDLISQPFPIHHGILEDAVCEGGGRIVHFVPPEGAMFRCIESMQRAGIPGAAEKSTRAGFAPTEDDRVTHSI